MTFTDDTQALITQLQQQQALFTSALQASLEGRWTGENSVEAFLYALNPHLQGTLAPDIPITTSEYDADELPKA